MADLSPRGSLVPAALGLAALIPLSPAALPAQHSSPPPPTAHALEDVTLVQPDGSRQEGVTVVVREGLVEAIGRDVEVPGDARLLEGDSLYVYPGLVDAAGEPRLEWPGADEGDGGEDSGPPTWNPDRLHQGFTPHRRAAEALTAGASDFAEARRAGVVASAVHPEGGMMPGTGALLLHRLCSDHPRDLVLRPELGPVMAFQGANRAYPSTHFGVVAFLRQAFEDAGHRDAVRTAHRRDPRGMAAPAWDPDLEAVARAASGEVPVFFRADGAQDIRQVLQLSDRYGFRPVIVGGEEAWKVADELAARDVPVLVSLDFPEPDRWDPEEEAAGEAEEEALPGEGAEELDPEVLREKRRIEAAYANAGRLVEAGVAVALTSGGGDADLREGARKAVEYGLGETAALEALTSVPARLLGVPWLTRVEPGYPANFLVADGPLLGEDTHVRYTFVEGRLERGYEPGAEPEEPPAVDVTGRWEVEGGEGAFSGTMTLEQEGARFDGTMETGFGTGEIRNGVVSGRDVEFTLELDAGGQTVRVDFSGSVSGDEMSGRGSSRSGTGRFSWEAERTSGPEGGGR